MKENSNTSSARTDYARNTGRNGSYATSTQSAGFYTGNFITYYQDILVVNAKCI